MCRSLKRQGISSVPNQFFFPLTVQISLSVSAGGLGTFFYWIWGNFVHQKMSSCLRVLQSTVGRFRVFVCWSCAHLLSWLLSSRRSKYYDTKDGVATFFLASHKVDAREEVESVEFFLIILWCGENNNNNNNNSSSSSSSNYCGCYYWCCYQ